MNDKPVIPNVDAQCDGPDCDKTLSLLEEHLVVQVKPLVHVLLSHTEPATGDQVIPKTTLSLGKMSGRGVIKLFHNFACAESWFTARNKLKPKLEPHYEKEIYVPEDNRSPEELVEAGELPQEALALHAAWAKRTGTIKEEIVGEAK
jgi:hypothetical protein